MAESVSIYDAKTHFSRLVSRVEAGEEITVSRNGRAVARIVPIAIAEFERRPGIWRGRVSMSESFDELTADEDADWYRS